MQNVNALKLPGTKLEALTVHFRINPSRNSFLFMPASFASEAKATFCSSEMRSVPRRLESSLSSCSPAPLSLPTTKLDNFCKLLSFLIPGGISTKGVPTRSRRRKLMSSAMLVGRLVRSLQFDNNSVCKLKRLHTNSGSSFILVLDRSRYRNCFKPFNDLGNWRDSRPVGTLNGRMVLRNSAPEMDLKATEASHWLLENEKCRAILGISGILSSSSLKQKSPETALAKSFMRSCITKLVIVMSTLWKKDRATKSSRGLLPSIEALILPYRRHNPWGILSRGQSIA
ncbi:unnamed protein product [Thlaspi arvense]|uniref:Uncharacterized protein n=1 Tax=Thlaspi arvense TaxID=13288 RepID=A0AAU9S279_THLAR|nr:unnamed protein product [Thlaspi arvense]